MIRTISGILEQLFWKDTEVIQSQMGDGSSHACPPRVASRQAALADLWTTSANPPRDGEAEFVL